MKFIVGMSEGFPVSDMLSIEHVIIIHAGFSGPCVLSIMGCYKFWKAGKEKYRSCIKSLKRSMDSDYVSGWLSFREGIWSCELSCKKKLSIFFVQTDFSIDSNFPETQYFCTSCIFSVLPDWHSSGITCEYPAYLILAFSRLSNSVHSDFWCIVRLPLQCHFPWVEWYNK